MDTIPHWLLPIEEDTRYPRSKERLEIQRITYESLFERSLETIMEGGSIRELVKTDPRDVSYGSFIAWIKSNPEREKRYKEARKVGSDAVLEKMKEIADGDGLEDVQRSKLRIDVRKIEIQAWDRERYGDGESRGSMGGGGGINIIIGSVKPPEPSGNVYEVVSGD